MSLSVNTYSLGLNGNEENSKWQRQLCFGTEIAFFTAYACYANQSLVFQKLMHFYYFSITWRVNFFIFSKKMSIG